jgi:hypothetical protein
MGITNKTDLSVLKLHQKVFSVDKCHGLNDPTNKILLIKSNTFLGAAINHTTTADTYAAVMYATIGVRESV